MLIKFFVVDGSKYVNFNVVVDMIIFALCNLI
jgi:hypothetical protein